MKSVLNFLSCFFFYLSSFFFLLALPSCQKNGTKPPDDLTDTTSHAFEWQVFEFPTNQFYSNIFWDIQAISKDNVWAVGTIYVDSMDSTGNFIPPYSIAHWNGNEWNLKQIIYKPDNTTLSSIKSLWYFNENNIWFASYSLFHFDGKNTYFIYRPDYGGINHLWAASENEIYGVGSDGLILRYNGSKWSKMESGTTMDFQDIWGTVDEVTGKVEVWAVGFDDQEYFGVVLKYNGEKWETLFSSEEPIYGQGNDHQRPIALFGVLDSVYIALDGFETSKIVRHSRKNFKQFTSINEEDQGAIVAMNGISNNDFFAVGYRDVVLHYNGKSFKKYFDWIYLDGRYHGVQQISDEVFICGKRFGWNTALILHGIRNTN